MFFPFWDKNFLFPISLITSMEERVHNIAAAVEGLIQGAVSRTELESIRREMLQLQEMGLAIQQENERARMFQRGRREEEREEREERQEPRRPTLRLPMPDPFDPDKVKSVDWLFSMDLYFDAAHVEDNDRVQQVVPYLRGSALVWWRGIQAEVVNQERELPEWQDFQKELKGLFQPHDDATVARIELDQIRQTGTVAEYTARFRSTALRIPGADGGTLLHRFMAGLSAKVKGGFQGPPEDLKAAMQQASFLEANQATWQGRGGGGVVPMDLTALQQQPQYYHQQQQQPQYYQQQQHYQQRPRQQRPQQQQQQGACFRCGQQGHFVAHCRLPPPPPNQGQRRQNRQQPVFQGAGNPSLGN